MGENENNMPTWGFTYRDLDGGISTKSFESESWVKALQEFVYFLRGIGFFLEHDSIQISDNIYTDEWYGHYCPAVNEQEDDWSYPDDTDLSMHYCPPFEGNPDDCAFKHNTDTIDEERREFLQAFDEAMTNIVNQLNDEAGIVSTSEPTPASLEDFLKAISRIKGDTI